MKTTWIVLAAAAAISGCAAADATSPGTAGTSSLTNGQCLRGNDVNNFNVTERGTAYVSTRQGYVFRLDAAESCFTVSTDSLSVTPLMGADPRVCVGDQARVRVGKDRSIPVTCIATLSGPIRDSAVSGLRSRQD